MKISYDDQLLIAGIGVTPWSRLGLEQWFPHYKILAYRDGGATDMAHIPPLYILDGLELPKMSTQAMVTSRAFKDMAEGPLAGYMFVPYRPVEIADAGLRKRFLMNDPRYTHMYENKVWLRETFGAELPFAPFRIVGRGELDADESSCEELVSALGGGEVVMQHESLSGGKGTYMVADFADYCEALQALPDSGKVVVSQAIDNAFERSIQCCATKYGTVAGRLQKQLVRNPELVHVGLPVVNAFCGGEIGTVTLSKAAENVVNHCIETIGARMAQDGYKGIFGLDFLIRGDEVFLLEVNARMTGLTPLSTTLSEFGEEVPLAALHVLELANVPYSFQAPAIPSQQRQSGSMLVLQHRGDALRTIQATLPSGAYRWGNEDLQLIRNDSKWAEDDSADVVLVQNYARPGAPVKPGQKLMVVLTGLPVIGEGDELNAYGRALSAKLYQTVQYAEQ